MELMGLAEGSGSNSDAIAGFGFPDYSEADRLELLGLMAQADMFRRDAHGLG